MKRRLFGWRITHQRTTRVLVACVLAGILGLCACSIEQADISGEMNSTLSEAGSTSRYTAAVSDNDSNEAVGVSSQEVREVTLFSDEELAEIIETLQSQYTNDYLAAAENKERSGVAIPVHGYHTDSTELEIASGIPVYRFIDGQFERENGGDAHYIFDNGSARYRLYSHPDDPAGFILTPFAVEYDYPPFGLTTDEIFELSTTKEFCLIRCAQGNVLYDGVDAWITVAPENYEYNFDTLDEDMASTPGLDELERGSILERQTFAYESPATE